MPYMQVKRGDRVANYTRGPNGKPTGTAHGSFPASEEGKKRADAQLRLLWSTYQNETKMLKRYKGINFKPPPRVAAIAQQALDAGDEISGVTRSLAFGHPIGPKTARQLATRFDRQVKDWSPFGGQATEAWVRGLVSQMDACDAKATSMKAVVAAASVDFDSLAERVDHIKALAADSIPAFEAAGAGLADYVDSFADQVDRPDDLRLKSAAKAIREAASGQSAEEAGKLLQKATDVIKAAERSRMVKSQSSANIGGGIPDDDMAQAKYWKGAEVYIRSTQDIGVVKAVGLRGKSFIYNVETSKGFTICTAKDMTFAGKSAMKALLSQKDQLVQLGNADPLTQDQVGETIQALSLHAKMVSVPDRPAARAMLNNLKAAWAVLRANPKAVDVAKTFIKEASDCLPDVAEPEYNGEATDDPGEEQTPIDPQTPAVPDDPAQAAKAWADKIAAKKATDPRLANVKAFREHISAIKAAGQVTDDDDDKLLDETEVLRAYAIRDGKAEDMAVLANVEEAVYSDRDPGMRAWADRVLGMVDAYQAQIAQVT